MIIPGLFEIEFRNRLVLSVEDDEDFPPLVLAVVSVIVWWCFGDAESGSAEEL